jgi:hypothetical protein
MDEATLVRTIESLGRSSGHADLTVHPGVAGDPDRDRYRWGYSWPDELEALCSAAAADAVHRAGFVLGSFDDLARAGARVG